MKRLTQRTYGMKKQRTIQILWFVSIVLRISFSTRQRAIQRNWRDCNLNLYLATKWVGARVPKNKKPSFNLSMLVRMPLTGKLTFESIIDYPFNQLISFYKVFNSCMVLWSLWKFQLGKITSKLRTTLSSMGNKKNLNSLM